MYGDIPDKINLFDKRNIQYNSKIQDLFVSNSNFYSEIYRRAFWYNGEILQCGSPRNDIFFTENELCLTKVQEYFHTQGKHMALYAPTYRNNFGTDAYRLDFERLRVNLEKRFGGEWVILVRLHPHNMMDAEAFLQWYTALAALTPAGKLPVDWETPGDIQPEGEIILDNDRLTRRISFYPYDALHYAKGENIDWCIARAEYCKKTGRF